MAVQQGHRSGDGVRGCVDGGVPSLPRQRAPKQAPPTLPSLAIRRVGPWPNGRRTCAPTYTSDPTKMGNTTSERGPMPHEWRPVPTRATSDHGPWPHKWRPVSTRTMASLGDGRKFPWTLSPPL